MHVDLEYLLLTIFIVLLVGLTLNSITNLGTMASREIGQNQLSSQAEALLNLILLTPGSPPDWDGEAEPVSFGLASSIRALPYELDGRKVYALTTMPPETIASLLGIERTYGFYMKVSPLYKVTINEGGGQGQEVYIVTVQSSKGQPIPNVNVTGYYGYPYPEGPYEARSTITDLNGNAKLVFDSQGSVLVVHASLSGVMAKGLLVKGGNGGISYKVDGEFIVPSDLPLIGIIEKVYGGRLEDERLRVGAASIVTKYRIVFIEESAYLFEFTMWRMSE
jgi:hypothetical protein